MRRNWLCWPGTEVEILTHTNTAITARVNRPWAAYFGERGRRHGVTLEEYGRLFSISMRRVADYHGLAYEERREGDRLVVAVSRR